MLSEEPLVAALPAGHPLLGQPLSLERLSREPFVLYPGQPRPSYADHVLALFATHGLSLRVTQWANEMQTAIGLVAAGLGATLVPASVQLQHRDDVAYQAPADASLTSPIIVSRRQGDGSPHLRRCLALIGREDA